MPQPQQSCPICASTLRRSTLSAHRWNDTDWRLVRCGSCSHRYTDPMPDDREIAAMYADGYFAEGGEWVCGYWTGSYIDNEANLRDEARHVLASLGKPCRLLEIGCAGGFFLDEAQKAGFDVSGVELNATQVEHAKGLGLDVICAPIETADLQRDSFDIVIAQDVLEHVRSPLAFSRRARTLLRPGGALVIRGPMENDARSAIYGALRALRRQNSVIHEAPFHLQGFTPRSFRVLMDRTQLTVRRFEPSAYRMPLRHVSAREIVSQAVEWAGYLADRVRGGGMFMVGEAVRH